MKLVDTELPFGKEGFTSYMGKNFDPSLRLTRRYYPHTYNVDGFFVAKFQKTGPTVIGSRGADASSAASDGDVDKAPILDTDGDSEPVDEFAEFDEDEDREYMERAKKSAMRRRGLDPKALRKRTGQ